MKIRSPCYGAAATTRASWKAVHRSPSCRADVSDHPGGRTLLTWRKTVLSCVGGNRVGGRSSVAITASPIPKLLTKSSNQRCIVSTAQMATSDFPNAVQALSVSMTTLLSAKSVRFNSAVSVLQAEASCDSALTVAHISQRVSLIRVV